jgi:hypothetical protein
MIGMMKRLLFMLLLAGCAGPRPRMAPPLQISWDKNILTVTGAFPGGKIETLYLEAYCRSGARDRLWKETVIKHTTEKLSDDGMSITLLDKVDGGVEVTHRITAGLGEIDFRVEAVNRGTEYVDAQWAQPCVRVGPFTGCDKATYPRRSFIFINEKPFFLDQVRRSEEAVYPGGQLYIPAGIKREDCNPRPHSPDVPSNGLIGCISANNEWLWATAWTPTQELFQGVILCLHNDFRLGGLAPGQKKSARGKMYIMENNTDLLLARYHRDF